MKPFVWILFILVTAVAPTRAQSYQVGYKSRVFVDPSRNNRNIQAYIYYPANEAGNNVPAAGGQFPVLVFGHGFLMPWSAYDVLWNAWVPHGYIMVLPATETSVTPSHLDLARDIAFLWGALKAEGNNAASPLFGAVASTSCVMGHSMGGGSAFLSVQFDTTITALATLASAVTNPSSIAAAATITIPSLVIAGSNDCITPPATTQVPMYEALASDCKAFVSITGASHCQFADYNMLCSAGEATCSPQAAISAELQQAITSSVLIPWLNYTLKGDTASRRLFRDLLARGDGITSQLACDMPVTGYRENREEQQFSLSPNPCLQTTLLFSREKLDRGSLTLYDMQGKAVKTMSNLTGHEVVIEREGLQAGVYCLCLADRSRTMAFLRLAVTDR